MIFNYRNATNVRVSQTPQTLLCFISVQRLLQVSFIVISTASHLATRITSISLNQCIYLYKCFTIIYFFPSASRNSTSKLITIKFVAGTFTDGSEAIKISVF